VLLLKLVQQLVKALNSEGTPGQVAAGIAFGSVLGLTPLLNLHNLLVFGIAMLLNVSFAGVMLGWALFVPVGFALDPLFDAVGTRLLFDTPALTALWVRLYNAPVVPYSNFNNTVVLGSFVSWIVLSIPIYVAARWGVARYRASLLERLQRTRLFQAVKASKLYNLYQLFQPR